jgi:hypothetical protein
MVITCGTSKFYRGVGKNSQNRKGADCQNAPNHCYEGILWRLMTLIFVRLHSRLPWEQRL